MQEIKEVSTQNESFNSMELVLLKTKTFFKNQDYAKPLCKTSIMLLE